MVQCDANSKDHRPDLPQVVIAMAVTRDGIPVRCWSFPGNTADTAIIRTVKDDLGGWGLRRLVWVADRGFASAANRAYLTRGGGHYIRAEKLRHTNTEAAAALARPGRYRTVTGNLRVKEVSVAPGGAGDGDQGGGPVWRYQDKDNYYVCRMNPLEDNFRLYKVVGGKRIQLQTKDVKAPTGQWHTIRVVHMGKKIQCYLNGKLLLEAEDDAIPGAGVVGLWTKADAQTYFADVQIKGKKE